MPLAVLVAQQVLSQTFYGGSAFDLADYYSRITKRNIVCTDRAVNGYGPHRFVFDEKEGFWSPEGNFLDIIHNDVTHGSAYNASSTEAPKGYPVDTITTTFIPLRTIGLIRDSTAEILGEKSTNSATLKLEKFNVAGNLIFGHGSASINDLPNIGLSKPVKYPSFFGKFWFSCNLRIASEPDFLRSVAQLASCKLKVTNDGYVFEPDVEQLRTRFLRAMDWFGDNSDSPAGYKQRITGICYRLASPDLIRETVTNEKLDQVVSLANNTEVQNLVQKLIPAMIEKYKNSSNPNIRDLVSSVDKKGEIKLLYKFGFGLLVAVPRVGTKEFWFI